MNEPIPDFTCDWCGKVFPADPRAMVESGFSAAYEDEPDAADKWKGEAPERSPATIKLEDASPEMIAKMKAEMGLNDAEVKELLETGSIENGASCVCLECQDAGLEESAP